MTEQDVLRILMKSRDRIAAATWLIVRDTQASEDIFQNVVIKAITKDVSFDNDGALVSWAFISARREGIDWLRKHKKETVGIEPDLIALLERDWSTESVDTGDSRMNALRKCVASLPEKSKTLLQLRYFDGFSCQEVADQLGSGLNAIYKQISRVHFGLRECIEIKLAREVD